MNEEKQIWLFKGGNVWDRVIGEFTDKKDDIQATCIEKQKIDLLIKFKGITIIELKADDLHKSLYPRGKTKKQTSLGRELKQHYLPFKADRKWLICSNGKSELTKPITKDMKLDRKERENWKNAYRQWYYTEYDYFSLIGFMAKYPEFQTYIYESRKAAIKKIYERIRDNDYTVNLNKPVYVTVGDWSLAQCLCAGINGFSLEFAQFLVDDLDLQDWNDCVEKLTEPEAIEQVWQWKYDHDISKRLASEIRYQMNSAYPIYEPNVFSKKKKKTTKKK